MHITISPYNHISQITSLGLQPDDVYQIPSYCEMDALSIHAQPILITATGAHGALALPLLLRQIPDAIAKGEKLFDAISPYGYAGILTNISDIGQLTEALNACRLEASKKNIVSIFIRMHPIHQKLIIPPTTSLNQVIHGNTVYINLENPVEYIKVSYSTGLKRDLRKLMQLKIETKFNAWEYYDEFIEAYKETMALHQASNFYYFSRSYFESLRQPEFNSIIISSHTPDGTFISGALFFAHGNTVQYHLGGTKQSTRHLAGSKLIFDHAIDYFKLDNRKAIHLGGGVGSAEDSLFRFKAGFSNDRATFSTLRIICDEIKYQSLSADKISNMQNSAKDFFPLYRL